MELMIFAVFALLVGIDSYKVKAEKEVVKLEQQLQACKEKCEVKK